MIDHEYYLAFILEVYFVFIHSSLIDSKKREQKHYKNIFYLSWRSQQLNLLLFFLYFVAHLWRLSVRRSQLYPTLHLIRYHKIHSVSFMHRKINSLSIAATGMVFYVFPVALD